MSTPIYTPDRVSITSHPGYVEVIVANGSAQVRATIGCHDSRVSRLNLLRNHLDQAKVDIVLVNLIIQQTQTALYLVDQLNARTP